jgi:hypothetical protein
MAANWPPLFQTKLSVPPKDPLLNWTSLTFPPGEPPPPPPPLQAEKERTPVPLLVRHPAASTAGQRQETSAAILLAARMLAKLGEPSESRNLRLPFT